MPRRVSLLSIGTAVLALCATDVRAGGTNITTNAHCGAARMSGPSDCESFIQGYLQALNHIDQEGNGPVAMKQAAEFLQTYSVYPKKRQAQILKAINNFRQSNTANSGGMVAPYIGCVLTWDYPLKPHSWAYDLPSSASAQSKCNLRMSAFSKKDYWENPPQLSE